MLPVGGLFEVEILEAGGAGAGGVEAEEFSGGEGATVAEGGIAGVELALGLDDEAGVDGAGGLVAVQDEEVGRVLADARPRAAFVRGKAPVAMDAEFGQGGVAVVVDLEAALGQFGAAERL